MIKNKEEYLVAKERLKQDKEMIEQTKSKLQEKGFDEKQIKLATDPIVSFYLGLKEEVEAYEKGIQ